MNSVSQLAELAEAEFMYQYLAGAPEPATLGLAMTRLGGGVALSMVNGGTPYWSKALGFGFSEPVTGALVEKVLGFYREQRTEQATIQIAPDRLPAGWDELRAAENLSPGSVIVQLAARVDACHADGTTDLRVGPVGPHDADEWAEIFMWGFEWPRGGALARLMAAAATNPRFRAYGVWDGDRIVAAGSLFVHGEVGVFAGGATLPSHRGRGAQSALVAARARAAADAGCQWLTGQAARPTPGSTNPSLDNMRRAGLVPLYDRRNWIWQQG